MNYLEKTPKGSWQYALLFGVTVSLIHRVVLSLWAAIIWSTIGRVHPWNGVIDFQEAAILPPLTTSLEQIIYGVWRRWDALHYLGLAWNGYELSNPGPSVFGALPVIGFRLFGSLMNHLDSGAMLFTWLCFTLALVFLYQFVNVYFSTSNEGNHRLAQWSVIMFALFPTSFFFATPLSEAPYIVGVFGFLCFAIRHQWRWAALWGAVAVLARIQGLLLLPVAGLLLLERTYQDDPPKTWRDHVLWVWNTVSRNIWKASPLILMLLAALGFLAFRQSVGFPSLDETYARYSFNFVVDPITGLFIIARYGITYFPQILVSWDYWLYGFSIVATLLIVRSPHHRRIPLLFYSVSFILLFATKINYQYGTNIPTTVQSLARYCATLFPIMVWLGDQVSRSKRWARFFLLFSCGFLLALYSAMFTLGQTSP
jgi:hypothetical protein